MFQNNKLFNVYEYILDIDSSFKVAYRSFLFQFAMYFFIIYLKYMIYMIKNMLDISLID